MFMPSAGFEHAIPTSERLQTYIKFIENSSYGNRVVPCGQSDMTKLIVVYRIFRSRLQTSRTSGIRPIKFRQAHLNWYYNLLLDSNV